MRVFNFSSYTEEAREYLQDSFQKTFFQVTDGVVAVRELTKIGSIVAASTSSLYVLASLDPTTPLKCTIAMGTSWLISSLIATKLEHSAKKDIADLKEDRQSVISSSFRLRPHETGPFVTPTTISPEEAATFGLI